MLREIGRFRALANASFALAALALGSFGFYQVAGRQWRVQPTFHVRARFETISGLEAGHRVRIQGIDAGVVERVVPPREPGGPVELVLRIDERLRGLVRADAVARIVSEGLVGAKLVELTPGKADSPQVAELDVLASEKPIELTELMQKAATSLARLDATTLAAEKGLGQVNAIAASISNGEGSLGKLIRDESLHQNLTELSHRSERALTALEDNLAALKETWPLSRYFERRAYADRDRVVFEPGSSRNSRALATDDLFEAGRAVLTPPGRARLDEIARWCKYAGNPTSHIVIAAYTDDVRNRDLAEILTQEQADSVRKYLVEKHAVQSAGWFKTRKVAAVGFGTNIPRTLDPSPSGSPSRRVEIILFTPQT
jgi:phospholipid/cholesterol/gamma-HCH transport system substrate-binding protein